jgi:DNA polymerase-3 subunit delta'
MLFSEVIGQDETKAHLADMVNKGKIPHAQLFLSQPGAGGLALALAFSQYIVCENRQGSESCGACSACIKAGKMIHPDIHYTYPVIARKPSPSPSLSTDYIQEWRTATTANPYINELEWLQSIGAENKQGNISADEARQILNSLKLTTFEAAYKIQLIWMAEALAKEGNILLKLLEEPPSNTVLILVAENQEEILPTIISRCQIVKINKISDSAIAEALLQKRMSQQDSTHMAYLADGNYNAALKLVDSETHDNILLLTQWLDYSINLKAGNLLRWTEETAKIGRENIKSFLEYSTHIYREAMLLLYMKNYTPRLAKEEISLAARINKLLSYEKLSLLLELVSRKHYEIERNVNAKMALLDMSIILRTILLNPVK